MNANIGNPFKRTCVKGRLVFRHRNEEVLSDCEFVHWQLKNNRWWPLQKTPAVMCAAVKISPPLLLHNNNHRILSPPPTRPPRELDPMTAQCALTANLS